METFRSSMLTMLRVHQLERNLSLSCCFLIIDHQNMLLEREQQTLWKRNVIGKYAQGCHLRALWHGEASQIDFGWCL